jgi:hypothetical protein
MKVYSKDLKLKLVDAVDRGMACQGGSAHPRGARRGHPGCALISQAEVRSGMVFTLRLRTTGSILIKTALRSGLRRNLRCVIHGVLTRINPSFTLTRPQYSAIPGNAGNRKPSSYAGIAGLCNAQQPLTAHSSRNEESGSSPLLSSHQSPYLSQIVGGLLTPCSSGGCFALRRGHRAEPGLR